MSDGGRKFRYRLEPLVKLRSAERDALKAELERAADEVDRKAAECDLLARAIDRAEGELRALCRGGAELPLDAHQRLQLYLRRQRELRGAKQRELDAAALVVERKLSELQLKLQDTKALESHRERKRRQFDDTQLRALMSAADERWLARKRDR